MHVQYYFSGRGVAREIEAEVEGKVEVAGPGAGRVALGRGLTWQPTAWGAVGRGGERSQLGAGLVRV